MIQIHLNLRGLWNSQPNLAYDLGAPRRLKVGYIQTQFFSITLFIQSHFLNWKIQKTIKNAEDRKP